MKLENSINPPYKTAQSESNMAMSKRIAYFYITLSRIISFSTTTIDLFDWVFDKCTVKRSRSALLAVVQLFPMLEGHAAGRASPCCHLACELLYFVVLNIDTCVSWSVQQDEGGKLMQAVSSYVISSL